MLIAGRTHECRDGGANPDVAAAKPRIQARIGNATIKIGDNARVRVS
ncbi:hypothetical protein [Burkholderia ubonensis]|nr:hypothetical protein [Burkholderia ubonensis]